MDSLEPLNRPLADSHAMNGRRPPHRDPERPPAVAIIHYWLTGMRGGEKVVEAICELFPDADIYTHVYRPERISDTIRRHKVRTTFIAFLPFARYIYKVYLPLMPYALDALDLTQYDLVISSESGPAKGVLTRPDAVHVCYCHTPMRYLWSGYYDYRARSGILTRLLMSIYMSKLRAWDLGSAMKVDHFIANSHNVAARIRKYYRREAIVIYPPVGLSDYVQRSNDDFYLFVSQLVSYKRADTVIDAFNKMNKNLVVVGRGEQYRMLKRSAGPTISLVGWVDDATLKVYYSRCRALVFIADEDFGIVPVEAMSFGRPVIAWAGGGVLETVRHGENGVLFPEQTPESLIAAVKEFEEQEDTYEGANIAQGTRNFAKHIFKQHFSSTVQTWMNARTAKQFHYE